MNGKEICWNILTAALLTKPVSKPPKKTKKKLEGQSLTLMEIISGKGFDITKYYFVDTCKNTHKFIHSPFALKTMILVVFP